MFMEEAMKKSLVLLSLVILLFGCGGMKEVDISKKEEKME